MSMLWINKIKKYFIRPIEFQLNTGNFQIELYFKLVFIHRRQWYWNTKGEQGVLPIYLKDEHEGLLLDVRLSRLSCRRRILKIDSPNGVKLGYIKKGFVPCFFMIRLTTTKYPCIKNKVHTLISLNSYSCDL